MAEATFTIGGFETGGAVVDSDAFSLAQNEWSNARNVRFDNRSVSKITGEQVMRRLSNNDPSYLTFWRQPNNLRYVYQTANGRSYLANATGTDSEITKGVATTRDPLTFTAGGITGGLFNGGATYVVADGSSIPQYINAIGSGTTTQELVDVPGWSYDSATFSSVIPGVVRPYRNVLVAGNLTFTATNNAVTFAPSTIRISGVAPRGVLPTWDPAGAAVTTEDEIDLASNDPIVDMVPFQDSLLIYCQNSVHALRLTGSTAIPVAVTQTLTGRGLLSTDCAVEYYGRHFVVGNDDIYLYGGSSSVQSVADERVRDYFFSNLDMANKNLTFVIHNQNQDEMWICYPKGSTNRANEAIIWNYKYNTWSFRDLPNVTHGVHGVIVDDFTTPTDFVETEAPVFINGNNDMIAADRGTSFSGQPINAFLERKGMDIDPNNDMTSINIASTYFIVRGTGMLDIRVRSTDTPGRPVDFQSTSDRYLKTRTFNLDPDMGDYKVDPRSNGRYMNVRIGTNDATSSWSLVRYNVVVEATENR